jgi:hypothetical protein
MAGASRRHAAITRTLTTLLQSALERRGCDAYASDLRLRVGDDLYFYPDNVVANGERDGTGRDETAPALLTEILSESAEHRDLGIKFAAYRSLPSLLVYLVVAQDTRCVAIHWREHENAFWRHHAVHGAGVIRLTVLGGVASLVGRRRDTCQTDAGPALFAETPRCAGLPRIVRRASAHPHPSSSGCGSRRKRGSHRHPVPIGRARGASKTQFLHSPARER